MRNVFNKSCVMFCCGSIPTEVILWFENGWILIIQARQKIRWINCVRLPITSKWSSGKDYTLCHVSLCFKSYRSNFVIRNVSNFNYTIYRKGLWWISCYKLSSTIKWSSGKVYRLCNEPLSLKSYWNHFVIRKWLNLIIRFTEKV